MTNIPEFIKLKAGYNFPFSIFVPCVRFRGDRKFTGSMAVVEISDYNDGDVPFTYLGEGFTSRTPRDKNDSTIGESISYARAIIDALNQHITYLKDKENK
jgi:hypothetical protein